MSNPQRLTEQAPPLSFASHQPTTVLVIEDEPSDAEIVRTYLEDQGEGRFAVLHAPTMESARTIMAAKKINAVMLDLFLPDTEDLSGLASIRSMLPSVPVLILTGRDDEELAFRAVETGAQDYLLKDHITPRMLRRSLRYAMQRKKFEDKITQQAHFDALTFLPNRTHFLERLEVALSRQHRTGHALVVMMLDLNGFKDVNDRYGHDAGDHVLRTIGHRFGKCLRPYDVVARFGGDEFVVLIEDVMKIKAVHAIVSKLCAAVEEPIMNDGVPLAIGVSIGIALGQAEASLSGDLLIQRADQAMYKAKKKKGRSSFSLDQNETDPFPA